VTRKNPSGPDWVTKLAPDTSKPAGNSTVSKASPGQGFVVLKLTSTLVLAPATSESGVMTGFTSAPGEVIVTPAAVPVSIVAPPATVVAIEKVPVVSATLGFLIPVRLRETVPP
jgi:hypothetical protein